MLRAANPGENHVGGRVVALNHHQRKRVMDAQVQAIVQCAQHSRAKAFVGGGHGNAVSRIDLACIHLAVSIHQQRDLDHAHGVHHAVCIDGDLFTCIQRLYVNPPIRAHALGGAFQAVLEQIKRVGRRDGLRRSRQRQK